MTPPIISLRKVSKRFRKLQALHDIDLDINHGEITGIIGHDGSGKSTLIKICSGVLSYEGSATVMGLDLRKESDQLKRDLSFMPQGIGQNLYMDLTVEENIDFFASIKDVPAEKGESLKERLLSSTGLRQFRERFARDLSGGMKQKLGICCSLISTPKLLLLDEPSTGIDPLSRRQLWELLTEFISGTSTTIILGTSYMDEAERCHTIAFLYEGRIIFSGSPEELIREEKFLEEAFFNILIKRGRPSISYEIPFTVEREKEGEEAIIIDGVTKYFGSFRALDSISTTIRSGEVFGLLGPNGAGKTTLIKCMLGLLSPDSGDILVSGQRPGTPELRRKIGYMSQVFSLYGDLTVVENIELYCTLYQIGRSILKERLKWVIGISGLEGLERVIVKRLPLGMKQRLALGCATLHLPSILFLDEPTSGVDPVARKSFWHFIRTLSSELGMTVIVTTHNLVEADYCDRIAIMNEGRLIAVDIPDNLRRSFVEEKGEVFELYPDGPLNTAIFTTSGIEATPFGRGYHLCRKGLEEEEIKNLLVSSGMGYRYLERITPPMEDVFIHYLERLSRRM
jgi:ABC-type multidrug transport system ATPase subunit